LVVRDDSTSTSYTLSPASCECLSEKYITLQCVRHCLHEYGSQDAEELVSPVVDGAKRSEMDWKAMTFSIGEQHYCRAEGDRLLLFASDREEPIADLSGSLDWNQRYPRTAYTWTVERVGGETVRRRCLLRGQFG
jgi:hypothetical protein